MIILAVTSFGQSIGVPSALFCAAWIVYLLVAPPPAVEERARVAISRVFFLATLAFAAIWFWMGVALPLTAWMFFLGDNSHWFYDYSAHIAAAIALLASLVAFVRTTCGTVSRRYVRFLAWSPPLLLLAAAAVVLEDYLSQVEGLTAESAAQHLLETNVPRRTASMRLEAHAGPPMFPEMPSNHKTFWIVDGREKVGLIMVQPNRLLGWQLSAQPSVQRFEGRPDRGSGVPATGRYQERPLLPGAGGKEPARHSRRTGGSPPSGQTQASVTLACWRGPGDSVCASRLGLGEPPFFRGPPRGATTTGCGSAAAEHNLLCGA